MRSNPPSEQFISKMRCTEVTSKINAGNYWSKQVAAGASGMCGTDFRFPNIGKLTPENAESKVEYFKSLGLSNEETASVILRYPQLLGFSLKENIQVKVEYLRQVGFGSSMREILIKFPQILSLSIDENLDPKISYLRSLAVKNMCMSKI
eukprot:jgi/Bigna1/134246/aug1.24_g8954